MRQGLYKRFKCLKIFNEFFNMYLFRWRKGGGGALIHVYVLEHIISLSYRTTWWMFTKLDRDEVLIITHLFIGFWANSTQGRIQGGGNLPKIGLWGVPSPNKGLLLQIRMQQQQTKCISVSWIEILRLLLFWLISQIWQSCFLIC